MSSYRIEVSEQNQSAVAIPSVGNVGATVIRSPRGSMVPIKIASGGELSRVMLAIKSLVSQRKLLPTLIFDEIDTGVSGDIAGKVGVIMQKMANNLQLIAITHLPQIAGMSDNQYLVYKIQDDGATYTSIKKLNNQERILEIAKMLSNEKVTEAALATAKELLSNN